MTGTPQHDPYGQAPQGPSPAGSSAAGQAPDAAAQAPYGQNPYGQDPYGQNPYGQAPYGQAPHAPSYGQGQPVPGQQWGGPQAPQQWSGQAPQQQWPGQQPLGTVQRPASITTAFWLIVAAGILTMLSTVISGVMMGTDAGREALREEFAASEPQSGLTPMQARQLEDTLVSVMPGVMITLGVLALVVYLLVAWRLRAGSRAARIIGTVFAALSLLLFVFALAAGSFSPFDVLWIGLGVAGIAVAYRKDATEYLRLKAWERASRR
ncbi:hypothetical protein [Micrococcus sp.]|uniref:hypothetical protein n=1 Tax=Micrococcus sp. TaxID=1271 RepID=UPI002A90B997|nr:hypothetical protein [Micrococcus sp.]MDY6055226.1 hypothetical protein [Micrococcus sp.]